MKAFVLFVFVVAVAGCSEPDQEKKQKPVEDPVYFDYQVSGDEERDFVTVLLQFRKGGATGRPLLLQPPARVELDGEVLQADSALRTGAFYEVHYDAESFRGTHTIRFTSANGKQYEEPFAFSPLQLKQPITGKVKGRNFSVWLEGVETGARVRYVLADTSFETSDVNDVQEMSSDGRIVFSEAELAKVKPGPVTLLLTLEEERPVTNGTRAGGRIYISHSLRRDFELVK